MRLPHRVGVGDPDTLWPVNHKYVEMMAIVVVSDNFDPNPVVNLVLSNLQ